MVRRASLVAAFLACLVLPAEGASPPVRRFPFWACSDGKGAVSLFWLPVAGEWPKGGYRLERLSRGRATVVGGPFRPGQDAVSMMAIDPSDAEAVRALADKIERQALSEEEKGLSISELGRAASADILLGRALGVRHSDAPGPRGKVAYRLTALDPDGGAAVTMESVEVDPARPTPAPGRPAGLRAEENGDGVALYWTDPPASSIAPVVGYRVDRIDGRRRPAPLTPKPLLLNRHLDAGAPGFLDNAAPAKKLSYDVRSVDLFGRTSAPVRVAIAVRNLARTEKPPGAEAGSKAAAPAATAAAPRLAAAPSAIAAALPANAPPSPPSAAPAREPSEPSRAAPAVVVGTDSHPAASAGSAVPRPPSAPADRAEGAPGPGSAPSPAVAPAPAEAKPVSMARVEAARPPAPAAEATAPIPAASGPGRQSKPGAVWSAAKAEPTTAQSGPPPRPVIASISGLGDRVLIRFAPGEPQGLTHQFVVLRSDSPTGVGVAVGRPIPGNAREWEDTTVSAGQYFWYRIVALDGAGNRGEPSKPKWVSTGSR